MCSGMEMDEQLLVLSGVPGLPKAIGERDLGRWRGKFWLLHFPYPTCRNRSTVAGADLILVPGSCVASDWVGGPSED